MPARTLQVLSLLLTAGDEAERQAFASSSQRRDLDRIGGMGSPLRQDTGDFELDIDLDDSLDGVSADADVGGTADGDVGRPVE